MVHSGQAASPACESGLAGDIDWTSDGTGIYHPSGSADLIRVSVARALTARVDGVGGFRRRADACRMLRRGRRLSVADPCDERAVAADAGAARTKAHAERFAGAHSPLQGGSGTGGLEAGHDRPLRDFKVYPICRWSGDLGPKVHEGDRQAPEGFYPITPALMNPNSNYYLAINTGFPNAYDRANGRHGALLMIHGDCSSRGCYAMTDEQIGEIYSLAREAFLGGQQSFQIQAYPFHMTPANLARHRTNPNMAVLADDQGRQRPFRGDASRAQGRSLQSALCVRPAAAGQFIEAAGVQPGGQLSDLRRSGRHCRARGGERAQRRGPVRPARQKQHFGGADQVRPRRRHEPRVPRPGRRQHSAGARDTAAAGRDHHAGQRRFAHHGEPHAERPAGIEPGWNRPRSPPPNSSSQGRGFFGNLFSSNKEPAAPQPSASPTTTAALQPAKPAQARTQTATLASPKTRSAEPRRPEPQETNRHRRDPTEAARSCPAAGSQRRRTARADRNDQRRAAGAAVGQLRQPLGRTAII